MTAPATFEAQYRLCADTCDNAAYPPPMLMLSHGREDLLIWQWNGDLDALQLYEVYMNGNRIARMVGSEAVNSLPVNTYAPSCGVDREFHVVAVGPGGRESPPSNSVSWEGEDCPRVIQVTFDRLLTYDTGDQEHDCQGPIFGTFWVSGSESLLPLAKRDTISTPAEMKTSPSPALIACMAMRVVCSEEEQ